MSIDKMEKEHFVLITYARQGYKDVEQFRIMLSSLISSLGPEKDIVIDFGTTKALTSPEIGAVARLAEGLKETARFVRLVPSDSLHKQFSSLNLSKIEHLTIYKNRQNFADHVMKM